MKKGTIVFVLSLVLGIGLFVAMVLKTGLVEIWTTLRQFSLLYFLIFIGLSTLNFCLYNLRWTLILQRLLKHPHDTDEGHVHDHPAQHLPKIAFLDLFLHRMAGFALSYITPTAQTGGEPLRILLLHQDGVPVKTATSSVIIDKGLEFASLFTFIAVGIVLALIDGSLPVGTKYFFWVMLLIFILLIFWFYYASIKNIGFFSSLLKFLHLHRFHKIEVAIEKIIEVEQQMAHFYKKNGRLCAGLVGISFLITGFLLLEHYLVARFLGVRLSFFQTFLVSTIPYIAYMIPVPGGLGLLEGGTAAIFAILGVQINAFVLVFIIRARDLVFVFIGLLHASKQGFRMIKKALAADANELEEVKE